jgi:adenine-specific DNA-methyltransferase
MTKAPSAAMKDSSKRRSHSGRYTDLDVDKLRGGYYTSQEVANWLVTWAIRSPADRVLEPSCGDGVFVDAAAARLVKLDAKKAGIAKALTGIEIAVGEAKKARERLHQRLNGASFHLGIETGDFFGWAQDHPGAAFDAIVGNPPFIRYQTFPEPHRSRAMELMHGLGLTPNRLTNIWVPFVVASVSMLKPGGRLALVLPAELLQVTYASQLRSFLTDHFKRIDIVACNELFFENAEQEVVLLLADGALKNASEKNLCRVALTETHSLAEIISRQPSAVIAKSEAKVIQHDQEKWLKYFLSANEIDFMRELRIAQAVANLKTHASVDVGVVTGKNEFFVLTDEQLATLKIREYAAPLVSRSAHLRGARLKKSEWKALSAAGDRVHLLNLAPLNGHRPSTALDRYIRQGEAKAVHKGYKCSIRTPWYAVPAVWTRWAEGHNDRLPALARYSIVTLRPSENPASARPLYRRRG